MAVKLLLLKAGAPVTDFVFTVAARYRNMDALFDAEFMVRPHSTASPPARAQVAPGSKPLTPAPVIHVGGVRNARPTSLVRPTPATPP